MMDTNWVSESSNINSTIGYSLTDLLRAQYSLKMETLIFVFQCDNINLNWKPNYLCLSNVPGFGNPTW